MTVKCVNVRPATRHRPHNANSIPNTSHVTIFAIIVASLGLLSTAGWVYMAFYRGWFWKTDVRLIGYARLGGRWPRVAVIVPARNESGVLPLTLPSLLKQDYPGAYHVYVVDDASTDGTAETARNIAEINKLSHRVTVTQARKLPGGWTGKVWAMQQGLEATTGFRARYLLLTDADIVHPADSLRKLVSHAVDEEFDTVSVMARLQTSTGWERFLMPAFVYFFSMLYPFRWVSSTEKRTTAAAGGCLLVRRAALDDAGGFKAISDRVIDDCSLARAVRDSGGRSWLGYAEGVESVRGYGSLREIWQMVTRSAYEQLKYSPLRLLGTVFGLGLLFVSPVLAAVSGTVLVAGDWPGSVAAWTALVSGVAAWEIMSNTYAPVLKMHGLTRERGLTMPFVAVLYLLMTVGAARRHHFGKGESWKGRSVVQAKAASKVTSPGDD